MKEVLKAMPVLLGRLLVGGACAGLASLSLALSCNSPVYCQPQEVGEPGFNKMPSSSNLVDLVRQAKVINPDYPLHALLSGKFATILTRRQPKATEQDLKIDAVLITKSVLDAYGYCLDGVKVLYREEDGANARRVTVSENDIKNYAQGAVDPQKFLDSIKIVAIDAAGESHSNTGNSQEQMAVSPGPLEDQRLLLMDRIGTLRKRGTGVAPYENIFRELDKAAQANNTEEVKKQVKSLADKLAAQEQLIRQAELVGKGQGVRGTTSTASASSPNEAFLKLRSLARNAVNVNDPQAVFEQVKAELDSRQKRGENVNDMIAELERIHVTKDKFPGMAWKCLSELRDKLGLGAAGQTSQQKMSSQIGQGGPQNPGGPVGPGGPGAPNRGDEGGPPPH